MVFFFKASVSDNYFAVDLQRPYPNSSFGFSIRGGREFAIPLFILKIAENGPAARDGRMKVRIKEERNHSQLSFECSSPEIKSLKSMVVQHMA